MPGKGLEFSLPYQTLVRARRDRLHAMCVNHLRFAALADHEAAQRRRLARQPDVVANVPVMDHDITDLAGLRALGDLLWPPKGKAQP